MGRNQVNRRAFLQSAAASVPHLGEYVSELTSGAKAVATN